jgi:hypothetical protein
LAKAANEATIITAARIFFMVDNSRAMSENAQNIHFHWHHAPQTVGLPRESIATIDFARFQAGVQPLHALRRRAEVPPVQIHEQLEAVACAHATVVVRLVAVERPTLLVIIEAEAIPPDAHRTGSMPSREAGRVHPELSEQLIPMAARNAAHFFLRHRILHNVACLAWQVVTGMPQTANFRSRKR